MLKRCLIIYIAIFSSFTFAEASEIYDLIKSGHIREAADSLSSVSTAFTRDGNKLFFLSLIEQDAEKAAQLLETSLKAKVSFTYRQEVYFRLVQYYYLTGNYERMNQLIVEYFTQWEGGKYRKEMLRYSTLVDEAKGAYDMALRQADRYLLEFTRDNEKQWGMLDKIRVMLANDKNIGAMQLLKGLSKEKSDDCVPQALYLLAMESIKDKRTDDAVFYYNILREAYPNSIGLEKIIEKMSTMSTSSDIDDRAEKLTDTYYSIKVGVFSKKSNANNQSDRFRQYGQKIDIVKKTIANKKYYVVLIGEFTSYASAAKYKDILEADHKEVFQVVAR